jgi:hypothetical protein
METSGPYNEMIDSKIEYTIRRADTTPRGLDRPRRSRRSRAGRARDVGREYEATNDATDETGEIDQADKVGATTRRGVDR